VSPNIRWRTLPDFDLYWRFLEQQYVVYHSGSGDTHVLDPIAALLVQQLSAEPIDSAALVHRIETLLNLEGTEGLREKLESTLSQLSNLGLIEPITFTS
jgi:PqqD family protein of HPr-rel-A system